MAAIRSRQHPLVKTFRTVSRGDATRALLDGWHLLREAIAANIVIDTVAIAGKIASKSDAVLVDELAARSSAKVVSVSTAVMNAISPVRSPTGAVAIVRRRESTVAELLSPPPGLVVFAIDVQDPGNTGAIIRAAEAGGATGVVLAGESADPWAWKALRAAMGSTFRVPIWRQRDAQAACETLRAQGLTLAATVARGGIAMDEADLRRPTALLLGGEGGGLSAAVLATADSRITIPMQQPVESLNVAVACGVIVYEARRQRLDGVLRERSQRGF